MCSKSVKIPSVVAQTTKLRNDKVTAHSDQSAPKRTRYTRTAVGAKTSMIKPKTSYLPCTLSNETINIPKCNTNTHPHPHLQVPPNQVHKSLETLSKLKRPHFTRAVSNEDAHSGAPVDIAQTVLPRHCMPRANGAKDTLPKRISSQNCQRQYPSKQSQSNASETLNLLKRPYSTRVVATQEVDPTVVKSGTQNSTSSENLLSQAVSAQSTLETDELPQQMTESLRESNVAPQLLNSSCHIPDSQVVSNNTNNVNVTKMLKNSLPTAISSDELLILTNKPLVYTSLVDVHKADRTCDVSSVKAPTTSKASTKFFKSLMDDNKTSILDLTNSPPTSDMSLIPELLFPLDSTLLPQCVPTQALNSANKVSATEGNFHCPYVPDRPISNLTIFDKNQSVTISNSVAPSVSTVSESLVSSQRPSLLSLKPTHPVQHQTLSMANMSRAAVTQQECFANEKELVTLNHIGQQVVVSEEKVGVLRYFGGVDFEPGIWCGIELDEPAGLNDGFVKGVRYFKCRPHHGILAPRTKVQLYKKAAQQLRDTVPISVPAVPNLLANKSVNCLEISEKIRPDLIATPNTSLNLHLESNTGSPKSTHQISNISKQNSFELDESLGILTPDQLVSFGSDQFQETSSLGFPNLVLDENFLSKPICQESMTSEMKNFLEESVQCESDGSDDLMSHAVLSKSEVIKAQEVSDQTLSPEDLPMDPPSQLHVCSESDDIKEVTLVPSARSQPPSTSCITSVTSIGSLDTDGYQGDGELSRPASRNNCTSPTVLIQKACVLKMKTSTQDPMTDSDFFTESDADVHDELTGPGRGGDRHAQVIDGTLYNNATNGSLAQQHQRCPSFTASINEEMESSGVFSDLERKPEENRVEVRQIVFSPDASTNTDSTKSEPSQVKEPLGSIPIASNQLDDLNNTSEINGTNKLNPIEQEEDQMDVVQASEIKELDGSASVISNASSQGMNDSKSTKKNVELKKYKMPKRNVVSKIKAMIEASPSARGSSVSTEEENLDTSCRAPTPKTVRKGRWDVVMSKIAQGQADEKMKPTRLKEVKSKVFAGLADVQPSAPAPAKRKLPGQSLSAKKENQTPLKTKSRRGRTRASSSSSLPPGPQTQTGSGASSQRSSLSDLNVTPVTKPIRSSKKVPARNVSPTSEVRGPTTPHAATRAAVEMKTPPGRKPTSRHKILRDHNRLAVCVLPKQPTLSSESPAVYNPPPPPPESAELRQAAKSVQALAVMVQYLVHEVDAFSAPCLKRRLAGMTEAWRAVSLERDELLAGHGRLQEDLHSVTTSLEKQLEELQGKHLEELHQVAQQCKKDGEEELSNQESSLTAKHDLVIANLFEEQHKTILSLTADHDQVVERLKETHQKEIAQLEAQYETRLVEAQERFDSIEVEYMKGKKEYRTMLESLQLDKDSRLQTTASRCKELQDEVDSLRTVLELRLQELQELRHKNALYEREKDEYQSEVNKNSSLQAKIEDLTAQLELKADEERRLSVANVRLSESFVHETYHSKRLAQHNEELQWKLKTQSELCDQLASGRNDIDLSVKSYLRQHNTTAESGSDDVFVKNNLSSSESSPLHKTSYLQRSDSVSWTFDMEDPTKPQVSGSGAVRRIRSFTDNNSTSRHVKLNTREKRRSGNEIANFLADWPPLTSSTPNKCCSSEAPEVLDISKLMRMDPVSGSSSIDFVVETDDTRPLPTLPIVVAVPKEAAGEAMISEETSEEDESCEQTTDEESSSEVALS